MNKILNTSKILKMRVQKDNQGDTIGRIDIQDLFIVGKGIGKARKFYLKGAMIEYLEKVKEETDKALQKLYGQ